jgi:hypothetical protein
MLCKALVGFGLVAVCQAVSPPSLLDPHLYALRQARVRVPEFCSTSSEGDCEALARDTFHAVSKLAHPFLY